MGNYLRILKWGNPGTPDKPNRKWEQENLVLVELPFVMRNAYVNGGKVKRCRFHRKGATRLLRALKAIWKAAWEEARETPGWAAERIRIKQQYGFTESTVFYDEKMQTFTEQLAMKLIRDCGGDIWGGSYVLRYVRGYEKQKILSPHAFGIAVDMNPAKNPMGKPLRTTFPVWYISAWESAGFTWGGRWSNRPDAMHWEL